MAYMPRRTEMANPATRKRRPARKSTATGGQRNAAPKRKRRLSLAQIAAGFGGKRRKSAAGAARKRKRTTANGTSTTSTKHRKRNPRKAKSNPGNIITAALGANPARPKRKRRTVKKGTSTNMARTKRRRRRATTNAAPRRRRRRTTTNAAPHRRRRRAASNPAPHRRRRRRASSNPARRRRRSTRNPSVSAGRVGGLVSTALYAIAGGVGSKLLTQAVLQGKNTGWLGYAGNLGVSFALGMAVKTFMRNSNAGNAVILGGVIQTVMRVLVDQTPLGETVKQFGVGDYMAQNYLAPQRVVDGLNSAALVPPVMPMMASAAAGVSGGNLY